MLQTFSYSVEQLTHLINWPYFFFAWQLPAGVAQVLAGNTDCPCCRHGEGLAEAQIAEGRRLMQDAHRVLAGFTKMARARIALFDANADGDDIIVYADGGNMRIPMLRQQQPQAGSPCLCLSDFLKPVAMGHDRIGIFATAVDAELETGGGGDKYERMLVQTLCDRLAEAAAEQLHLEVRTRLWGYALDERLSVHDLLHARYQGIRPAVGYPSMPDQSVNFLLDGLIDMSAIGISLTETGAMRPHASVSGLMLAHQQARYFDLGRIGDDQLADYALRRGMPVDRARQYLAAHL